MKTWVFNPHVGGVKISRAKQSEIRQCIEVHAASHNEGRYIRLKITFRGALCYIDAFTEPEPPSPSLLKATGETKEQFVERLRSVPTHLGRLRYFGGDRWSYAFYTYRNERYEPTIFPTGDWFGTPEEAFDIGATYLRSDKCGLVHYPAGYDLCYFGGFSKLKNLRSEGQMSPFLIQFAVLHLQDMVRSVAFFPKSLLCSA